MVCCRDLHPLKHSEVSGRIGPSMGADASDAPAHTEPLQHSVTSSAACAQHTVPGAHRCAQLPYVITTLTELFPEPRELTVTGGTGERGLWLTRDVVRGATQTHRNNIAVFTVACV